jgi:DNA polymerase-3 subunit beta
MEISVLQEKLSKGMTSISKVVSSRPTLPILSNVLLVAESGRLQLFATDLNLGIRLWVGSKVKKEGKITVPAKVFSDLVSSFSPSTVNISAKDESLGVSCDGNKVRISGIAASEFPKLGKVSSKKGFTIEAASFKKAVERVVFAASTDETRPILSGVLWRIEGKNIQLVATDGYRLSLAVFNDKKDKGSNKWINTAKKVIGEGIIIPSRAIKDVVRLLDEFGASELRLNLMQDQNLAVFSFGDCEVTTRLIEGKFPNYSQVIPKEQIGVAEIDVELLNKAVRTAAIFARDSANIIHWKIDGDKLVVSANAPSYGESESSVEITMSGDGGEIAFNSRYLLEFLSILSSKTVSLGFKGSLDPGVFHLKGKHKDNFLHLIMPVRVQK